MGIYTLLVYSEHGRILLNKQISAPCYFTVATMRNETIHTYLLHNQWIGLDEHIDFLNGRIQTKQTTVAKEEQRRQESNPKSKPKRSGKKTKKDVVHPDSNSISTVPTTQSASKQDEMDLLNFISWEDTPQGPVPPGQRSKQSSSSEKREHAPSEERDMRPPKKTNTGLSLCSFLERMFS